MSSAQQKNQCAIKNLVGNEALSNRLLEKRIAVVSTPDKGNKKSAILLAEGLGDLLGRLWRNIDCSGPLSGTLSSFVKSAAASGKQSVIIRDTLEPPYDFVIGIATNMPENTVGLRVGASGWNISIGTQADVSDDPNPVGPLAAACFAASETFKVLFSDGLGDRYKKLPQDYSWSSWYGDAAHPVPLPSDFSLNFDNVHIFGIGSVSHSLVWLLERWPTQVSGQLFLIDHDSYDESNGQRYIGMRPDDIGKPKVEAVEKRLAIKHPMLAVKGYPLDMNRYFTEVKSDCKIITAVSGLDSIESRRQLQLKLPNCIIDMWTSAEYYGACRYTFRANWPCAFCIHPDNLSTVKDEVAEIFRETQLKPPRIRHLLNSGEGLSDEDAALIAPRYGIDKISIIGQPLRSVRGQLCATGKINLSREMVDADVPLAFSAGLAGVGGFVELSREVWAIPVQPGYWQASIFRYPTEWTWFDREKKPNCYLCSDTALESILREKYQIKRT